MKRFIYLVLACLWSMSLDAGVVTIKNNTDENVRVEFRNAQLAEEQYEVLLEVEVGAQAQKTVSDVPTGVQGVKVISPDGKPALPHTFSIPSDFNLIEIFQTHPGMAFYRVLHQETSDDAQQADEVTSLVQAVEAGDRNRVLELLSEWTIDLDAVARDQGKNLINIAKQNNHEHIATLLEQYYILRPIEYVAIERLSRIKFDLKSNSTRLSKDLSQVHPGRLRSQITVLPSRVPSKYRDAINVALQVELDLNETDYFSGYTFKQLLLKRGYIRIVSVAEQHEQNQSHIYFFESSGFYQWSREKGLNPLTRAPLNRAIVQDYGLEIDFKQQEIKVIMMPGYFIEHLYEYLENDDVDAVERALHRDPRWVHRTNKNESTPLMIAAKNGNKKIVETLLKYGASVNYEVDELSALYIALAQRHASIVQILLERPDIDITVDSPSSMPTFMLAADNGDLDSVDKMIKLGVDVNKTSIDGLTALFSAAEGGYTQVVSRLLQVPDIEIDTVFGGGFTPLFVAAAEGHQYIAGLLIERGANTEHVTDDGKTLLHMAAGGGNVDLVRSLIDQHGLDVDAVDHTGRTPLFSAVKNGRKKVADLLIERGANAKLATDLGYTLLHAAASGGNADLVRSLIDQHEHQVHAKSGTDNFTPLMFAAENGHLDAVNVLLDRQAGVNMQTSGGTAALHHAVLRGHIDVVRRLLQVPDIDVNRKDIYGGTALMQAAGQGNYDMVQALLDAGAQVNVRVNMPGVSWHTALDRAEERGYSDVARLLREHEATAEEGREGE